MWVWVNKKIVNQGFGNFLYKKKSLYPMDTLTFLWLPTFCAHANPNV